nr:helix-turn-helix domain-containing protein [Pseudogracilibacillus auburnensis]
MHISNHKWGVSFSKRDVFQAMADPTRRKMLKLLATKEMSIASILECFPVSRTTMNKHLHVLFDARPRY